MERVLSSFAASWYRVAGLRPRLRAHADIHRHRYRSRLWYVLQDRQNGRFFRISPGANLILSLMDGRRTMEEIWRLAGDRLGSDRPTRADTLGLLAQVHQADLLLAGLPPDMAEIERRAGKQQRNPVLALLRNPMAMRFPLLDPDHFLERTLPLARLLFNPAGLVLWSMLIGCGAVVAALHWPELTAGVTDRLFSAQNVLVLALAYPTAKLVHELAHAYATKLGGGEVHEMGVMMLVLFPVPYVDASASSALPGRWQRAGVAAAGVMVELAIASVAMIAWANLGPGLPRAVAYTVLLLCGVTTLLFNANPLLRFDGYYVLSDLLEMPNLDGRSKRYLLYVLQRYVLGHVAAISPAEAPGERKWLGLYGIAAAVYRIGVMLSIAELVASRYFVLGAALAILTLVQMIGLPVARGLRYLVDSPSLRRGRRRAMLGAGGLAALVAALLFIVPVPLTTVGQGVVWVPDEAALRAGADGVVNRLDVPPDTEVAPGQALITLEDPVATAEVELGRADVAVLEGRFLAVNLIDRVQALLVHEALDRSRARLARAEQHRADLGVIASRAGRFVVPDASKLAGRFVRKGTLLGYVIGADDPGIHVVVPQTDIDLVRSHTRAVTVRFTEDIGTVLQASVLRETPSALERVPASGLSQEGGGPMLLDPASPERDRPLQRFFEIELKPLDGARLARIGSHAYARFSHAPEPLAWRLWRSVHQVFLHRMAA